MGDATPTDARLGNADAFVRALWPDRFRCLGFRLSPLTIGHLLVLRRVESRLVTGSAPDAADLALAVFICGRTWKRALAAVSGQTLRFRLMLHAIAAHLFFPRGLREFSAYLQAGLSGPKWWTVPGRETATLEVNSPFWLTVMNALRGEIGMTQAETLDCTASFALWTVASMRERDGQIQIVSDAEATALGNADPFGPVAAPASPGRN